MSEKSSRQGHTQTTMVKICCIGAGYWRQVVAVNDYQKSRVCRWRHVCRGLLGDRAHVSVYDSLVSEKQIRRDTAAAAAKVQQVRVARDAYEAAQGAHGLCVLTEWDEFRTLDYRRIFVSTQKPAFVFDGRNVVDVGNLREIGFVVYTVGKPLCTYNFANFFFIIKF
ncbi:UDP-glucose 6-dehydrogenase 5-like [Phragmites australis]|uniref:UDP-glucose 6-dehydrogenase 5-like n=1 Tax=Phragmites australis TaxID=29695 RepID=UPI002D793231|nr:UDP-glucose 6-dehydrogenase 5-like [Phragmites australis]